ncbi:MAG: hypothetical protein ABIJ50_08765 [Pseudomonadota bacterium]
MSSYPIAILLTSILFCTGTTVLAIMLTRSNRNKDKLLTEMQATLARRHPGITDDEHHHGDEVTTHIFDDHMREAELTTRLQQSRLTAQHCGHSPAPERYRYIHSMVRQGMNAQEIAATLSMSVHEISQIISLIQVAHPRQEDSKKPVSLQQSPDNRESTSAIKKQPTRRSAQNQSSASMTACTVNKSIKLAKWLKLRAVSPWCLRKQSSREPPVRPSPQAEGISCRPLPGYT